MALYYTDASALVKLVRDEPQSDALRSFLADSDLVSCALALTETPRAIRYAATHDPELPLQTLIERTTELLEAVALLPLDRRLLTDAGKLGEPLLRSLDAIHVTAAAKIKDLDGFVSYDERQSAAARLVGLRTIGPS